MSNQHSLTDEQIEMLRLLIQDKIEVSGVGIEGVEEGVWDLNEHDDAPWLEITYDAFKLTSDPE